MAAGFVPRVVQTAPDSWTLVVLVGAGLGCSLTLDSVRDNIASDGVSFVPLARGGKPLEVRMIWRALMPVQLCVLWSSWRNGCFLIPAQSQLS